MTPVPPVEVIAIAAALFMLALSVMFARAVRGTGPSRARRILLPAATILLGTVLVMGLPSLFFTPALFSPGEFGWGVLIVGACALVSAAAADGIAGVLGAERTPRWLVAGLVAANLLTYAGLTLLSAGFIFALGPLAATPALIVTSGMIVWWPYLPRPEGEAEEDGEAAEVFD